MSDQTDDQQPYGSEFGGEPLAAPEAPAERRGNVPLAILAGLAVAALGVALWTVLYVFAGREIVGVSVLTGFAVGYVMREVSRRSTVPVRVGAAIITAIVCLVGNVVARVAYTAAEFDFSFWTLLEDVAPDTFKLLFERDALTLAIFAAAVVVAYMAAGPKQAPKQKAADPVRDENGEPPAMDLSR